MSDGLRDPKLPPGAVVEVDAETGEGIRNDGKRLKPAEKNKWYVLATIAGVQEGTFSWLEVDEALAAQNRRYWNGWACAEMSGEQRAALAETMGLPEADLAPLSEEEQRKVEEEFARRLGPDEAIPDPSEAIDFGETHFSHTKVWEKCAFPATAHFPSATFSGPAHFPSATFSGPADFSNEAFAAQTVFREARFLGGVPRFYQRDLHQDTTFTTKDAYWPEITDDSAEDAKQAYARLRQVMNDLQKPDDEHFFFRREMRCKARLEGRFYAGISKAFEAVSDYGHSLGRPLGWMGVVMALPLPGYAVMLREAGEPVVSALAKAAGLSFANTFAFFGFRRVYFGEVFPEVDALTAFIAGTQTVLGFALLFFLGLGLRNRFRLK